MYRKDESLMQDEFENIKNSSIPLNEKLKKEFENNMNQIDKMRYVSEEIKKCH